VRLIGFLVVLILAIIFVVQNRKNVTTHFVFFTVTAKLWVGFLVSLALGALIGYVGSILLKRSRHE
jgi:uncharacterized integral membrane protein